MKYLYCHLVFVLLLTIQSRISFLGNFYTLNVYSETFLENTVSFTSLANFMFLLCLFSFLKQDNTEYRLFQKTLKLCRFFANSLLHYTKVRLIFYNVSM